MDSKEIESDRYFDIDIEKIYLLNMIFVWGGYLVGSQVE